MAVPASSPIAALPQPRSRLIGREAEVATARAFLLDEAVPLLTLTGPGGVGKTRLALAVAQEVTDAFADGVVFIDLAPLADPGLVAETVAAVLAVSSGADRSIEAAIVASLRPRQTLLLIDNCEHVLAAVANLVATLLPTCPAVQVLATSRAPLHVRGEQVLAVAPLALPASGETRLTHIAETPAVRLFVQRARLAESHFAIMDQNAGAIAGICQTLDGLPLALELAASRAGLLSPAALLALLDQRLQVLGTGPRDAPARQRTMHDAIAWSYDLLVPEEQAFFRTLAIFAGGWTLEAAASVSGLSVTETLDRIERLVEQSLVVRQSGDDAAPRFTMLETIREFGRARLVDHGEDAEVQDHHAAYFIELAEAAELHLHGMAGDQARWMARMDAELGNLRAAIAWLLAIGDGARALRLIVGIESYIGARFLEAEARKWVEAALALAPDAAPLLRAATLYGLISRAAQVGDLNASLAAAEKALALVETSDEMFALGRAYFGLGLVWSELHDSQRAAEAYTQAVYYLRQTERVDFLGLAISGLGDSLHLLGELTAAEPLLNEALTLYPDDKDPWDRAVVLGRRAYFACSQGDHELAVRLYGEAINETRKTGDEREVMYHVANLAGVALETGQHLRAVQILGAVSTALEGAGFRGILGGRHVAPILATLRAELEEQVFLTAWNLGRTIPWADAIADALGVLDREHAVPVIAQMPPQVDSFDFTRREREVLSLLCQRLTDAEIAQRLFISPRTASSHVSNLLSKLGASSRREAAAYAARHGLV